MFLLYCYLIALLPIAIAAAFWYFNKKIVWWESLVTCLIGILVTVVFHIIAIKSMTDDFETWSGQVMQAVYIPKWLEYYEYAVYRTEYYTETEYYSDSNGRSQSRTVTRSREVFDHWQPTTRLHDENWYVIDTVNGEFNVTKSRYDDIVYNFGGGTKAIKGCRTTFEHASRMISGDENDYHAVNKNNFVYPTNATKQWENRVKAAPSVFSYAKIPENVVVIDYPINTDKFSSNRIVGKVGVNGFKFDQMNSELGPTKFVNVILVGLENKSMDECNLIESKWIGGKKNDIVICFGGSENVCKPTWCKVFGWTESDLCKLNLQSIVLKHGMTDATLPFIKEEIKKNYFLKDWTKFDYLTVEVSFGYYIWLLIIIIITIGGWLTYCLFNDKSKE